MRRAQAAASLLRALARATSEAQPAAAARVSNAWAPAGLLTRRGFADDASLLKTPLYDFHVNNGGASGRRRQPVPAGVPAALRHGNAVLRLVAMLLLCMMLQLASLGCNPGLRCLLETGCTARLRADARFHHASSRAAGKMVPFAGWSMPIQYKVSLCRTPAS